MAVVSDYTAIVRQFDKPSAAWNASVEVGSPVIVSYGFLASAALPLSGDVEGGPGSVVSFTPAQRDAFRAAVAEAASVAGVIFVESSKTAMINVFGVLGMDAGGRASYPSVSDAYTSTGSLYIDFDRGTTIERFLYEIVLHELGHGLGLSHPHEGSLILSADVDTSSQTVMSYNDESTPRDTYGPLDIEALQYLYGPSLGDPGWSLRMKGATLAVIGSGKADTIHGIEGPNDLRGAGGKDLLIGRAGSDTLRGGGGNDTLMGQYGNDVLVGAAGDDLLQGDGDSDSSFGNDRLVGGKGNDTLLGIEGADTLIGGAGRDLLVDGDDDYTQSDLLKGGSGNDTLIAGQGSDTLLGGAGRDVLRANAREGYAGDVLDGGTGNDRMFGSAGFDDFVFASVAEGDRDTIIGFDPERDEVDFRAGSLDPEAARIRDAAGGKDALVIFDLGDGDVILRFKGIPASVLESYWDLVQL